MQKHQMLIGGQWADPAGGQWFPSENPFTGQAPVEPEQVSATSHWPAEARHVYPAVRKTSTQELLDPVQ